MDQALRQFLELVGIAYSKLDANPPPRRVNIPQVRMLYCDVCGCSTPHLHQQINGSTVYTCECGRIRQGNI